MKRILFSVWLVLTTSKVLADSPITSTTFYSAFADIHQIVKASEKGILDYESASFLSGINPIDQKIALINALGWSVDGKNNKGLYEMFLNQKYKTSKIQYEKLTAEEHLCVGYLAIMDNYFHLREPLTILKAARKRNSKSYTFNIVYGLALAQLSMDNIKDDEWDLVDTTFIDTKSTSSCNIYLICAKIDANKSLAQDFRVGAKREIFSYLTLYKHYCSSETLVLIPSTDYLSDEVKAKISLIKKGGVYMVPTLVNGIPMQFIFDTGASSVSISLTEASYLAKCGKLSKNDVLGSEYFLDANGDISEGTKIILQEIKIGNKVLNDVQASVVHNARAPLLLGQTALEKLGKVVLDTKNQTLHFE